MIGQRIKQARLAAGFSLDDLAARLSELGEPLSKAAISNYEREKRTAKPSILIKLGQAIGLKASFFLSEPTVEIVWIAFRRHYKPGKKKREEIKAYARLESEKLFYLQSILQNSDNISFPKRHPLSNFSAVEKMADELRRKWGLGVAPVISVTQCIETNGGFLIPFSKIAGREFDGLTGWVNGKYPLIVVNSNAPLDRLRFDIAHELGHLIIDGASLKPKEEESLAHRFAASFLVPASSAKRELGSRRRAISFDELAILKQKWGLSMAAWIRRAFDLDIISASMYKNMNIELNKRGWRMSEPVEFTGNEDPAMLKQLTMRALVEDIITPEKAENLYSGALNKNESPQSPGTVIRHSARELMKTSREKRREILQKAAEPAQKTYAQNKSLTDFEAFGEDDIHG